MNAAITNMTDSDFFGELFGGDQNDLVDLVDQQIEEVREEMINVVELGDRYVYLDLTMNGYEVSSRYKMTLDREVHIERADWETALQVFNRQIR